VAQLVESSGAVLELEAALVGAQGRIDTDVWEWLLLRLGEDDVHGQHVLSDDAVARLRAGVAT
jgi:hypothetical protein